MALLAAGNVSGAVQYTDDGIHTAKDETARWFLNRQRHRPEYEADRLAITNTSPGGHPGYDTCEDSQGTNFFGLTTNGWAQWQKPRQPLAPNGRLYLAASNHSLDMASIGYWKNGLDHYSLTNTHYPLNSSPSYRMTDAGYVIQYAGENLSATCSGSTGGYPALSGKAKESAEDLFIDTDIEERGHRQNILSDNFREVGIGNATGHETTSSYPGYFFTSEWYTYDFGSRSLIHFFTGTMMYDADNDDQYDEGEGVGGIEIRLFQNGVESTWYDLSTSVGSFAVPISNLTDNAFIEVRLVNKAGGPVTLSLPTSFYRLANIYMTNNETRVIGEFKQPATVRNVGLTDVNLMSETTSFALSTGSGTSPVLGIGSMVGAQYKAEYCTNLVSNVWYELQTFISTALVHKVTDTNAFAPGVPRFYRIKLISD